MMKRWIPLLVLAMIYGAWLVMMWSPVDNSHTQFQIDLQAMMPRIYLFQEVWEEAPQPGNLTIHLNLVDVANGSTATYPVSGEELRLVYTNGTSEQAIDRFEVHLGRLDPSAHRPYTISFQPDRKRLVAGPAYEYTLSVHSAADAIALGKMCHNVTDGNPSCRDAGYEVGTDAIEWNGVQYPLHPNDVIFQRMAWSCCHLRSFPAYDAYPNFTVPVNGRLSQTVSFPVKPGTVNGSLTLRAFLGNASRPVPILANLNLQVLDANDTAVGSASAPASSAITVSLPTLPSKGIYHARLEVRGAPNASVVLEVHVNDTRDWAHDPFAGMKEPWES